MLTITADALARQYRDLPVMMADGRMIYGLDVHQYRNFDSGTCNASMAVRQQLENAVAAVCPSVGNQRYRWMRSAEGGYYSDFPPVMPGVTEIVAMYPSTQVIPNAGRAFLGKGMIEDIQLALRLAVDFGFAQPTKASLQAFIDTNIGLDCSGFAAALYRGDWIAKGASAYLQEANATRIRNLDDIRPSDAVVFQDGEHVGIIYATSRFTSGTPGETRQGIYCSVAEATSDDMNFFGKSGLNLNDYRVMQNSNGGFTVRRPLDKQPGYHEPAVYIVRPVA